MGNELSQLSLDFMWRAWNNLEQLVFVSQCQLKSCSLFGLESLHWHTIRLTPSVWEDGGQLHTHTHTYTGMLRTYMWTHKQECHTHMLYWIYWHILSVYNHIQSYFYHHESCIIMLYLSIYDVHNGSFHFMVACSIHVSTEFYSNTTLWFIFSRMVPQCRRAWKLDSWTFGFANAQPQSRCLPRLPWKTRSVCGIKTSRSSARSEMMPIGSSHVCGQPGEPQLLALCVHGCTWHINHMMELFLHNISVIYSLIYDSI